MKGDNPIEKILATSMENLKKIIDVDTVVGKPINLSDGTIVLPISKVCMGFVSGGGEYSEVILDGKKKNDSFPFAGGSGAGVCVTPVAMFSLKGNVVKMDVVEPETTLEKIVDFLPKVFSALFEKNENYGDK